MPRTKNMIRSHNRGVLASWVLVLLFEFLQNFSWYLELPGAKQYSELAVAVLLLPYVVIGIARTMQIGAFILLIIVGFYVILAAIHLILLDISLRVSSLQLALDMKLFYVILAGVGVHIDKRSLRSFEKVLVLVLTTSLFLSLAQIANKELYLSLFDGARLGTTGFLGIVRTTGIFIHPTVTGYMFGLATLYFLWRYVLQKKHWYSFASFMAMIQLVLSQQRQEIAAVLVVAIFILMVYHYNERHTIRLLALSIMAVTLTFVTSIVIFLAAPAAKLEFQFLEERPRFVQMRDAVSLANDHFPLGVGLGYFGGNLAERENSPVYYELGYGQYWWYKKKLFLSDTFWAKPIAEIGWFGFLVVLFFLVWIILLPLRVLANVWQKGMLPTTVVGGALLWALFGFISSPTAPLYYATLFLVPWGVYVGCALRMHYQNLESSVVRIVETPKEPISAA